MHSFKTSIIRVCHIRRHTYTYSWFHTPSAWRPTQLQHLKIKSKHSADQSAALQPGLDSPKPCVEHGQPGSSIRSVSGGAEQEVLLDGHVADERQDEQRHAEHDEPQRAGYPHHPASLRAPAPPDQRITDGPRRGDSEHPRAPHPRWNEGVDARTTRASRRFQSPCGEGEQMRLRGSGNALAANRHVEMLKAGRANEDAQTADLWTLLTEAMKAKQSMCGAGLRSGGPRFYSRRHNLNMRQGGSDASAEEKAQEERLWRIDSPWVAEEKAEEGGGGVLEVFLQACGVRLQPDSQPRGGEMKRRRPAGWWWRWPPDAAPSRHLHPRRLSPAVSLIKTECRFKETRLLYRGNQINSSSSIRGGALRPDGRRETQRERTPAAQTHGRERGVSLSSSILTSMRGYDFI